MLRHYHALVADQLPEISAIGSERAADLLHGDLQDFFQVERASNGSDDLIDERSTFGRFPHLAIQLSLANGYRGLIGDGFDQVGFPLRPRVRLVTMMKAQDADRFGVNSNRGSKNCLHAALFDAAS